jgi:uncharacterized protein YdeI (YjbR/CyaY-like superfamily)
VPWATQGAAAAASVGPMATLLPELLLNDPAALRTWLEEHHATSPGVRLVLTKKGGMDTTITWVSAVEELLCFGWIDGQAGKRDEGNYTVRITPRRPKGSWSQRNVALVAMLEEQGRMTDAGRAAVEAARADGRWDAAYAGPATRQPPDDLAAAIAAQPDAQAMFDVLTSANRFALIHRVEDMKRAESRARKVTEIVEMLARGETIYPQKAGHPGRPGQGADAPQSGRP